MTEDVAARRRPRRENALVTLARIPVVRRMWAAITFSSLGDWLGLLANTALAQQLTHQQSVSAQGAAISGVFLVRLAPDLFFGPIAAALADKLDRRRLVIIGDLAAGILYASIAIGYNLVWLYIAQFVIEAVGLFTQPAKQVIQVTIVPKRLLATANQVSLFSVYGMALVASGLFALLSAINRLISGHGSHENNAHTAIVIALLINAVSFGVSAGTVFVSRHDIPVVPAEREQQKSIFALLSEGVSFVRHQPLIRGLYVGIIGAFAAGGLTAGVAQLWVRTLSAGTAGYAIMFGAVFGGLAIGMLLGPRVLPGYTRSRVFGLAIGGAGATLVTMSFVRDFILAAGMATLVGTFAGMAWIIGYTLIGHEVEERLRGRIFAFVLSSVRMILLLTIGIGPVLAGALGSHSIPVGDESRLRFSGPALTLLIGGVLALGVSYYASTRATRTTVRVRDIVRGRVVRRTGAGRRPAHRGLFLSVDGADESVTARYAELLRAAMHEHGLVPLTTAEPTDSAVGHRVTELMRVQHEHDDVEPETAALLSAADRAQHVATMIRPALDRGEVVICDRYLLTSLAVHGGGQGADIDRIRSVNAWSTGELLPDLTLVVVPDGDEEDPVTEILLDAVGADPDRCVPCYDDQPAMLPDTVISRLGRLLDTRRSVLTTRDSLP